MGEAPLAKFKNENDFEAWLRGKPREVAVALAARAALLVLPVVQTAKREGYMGGLVLPVFRATAVSWAIAKYPAHKTESARAAYAARASRAAAYATATDAAAYAAAAAAAAAAYAADDYATRAAAADAYAYSHAADAATRAARAAAAARADFWFAVSTDATRVEQGAAASVIAGSPLWPQPQGQPDRLRSLWQEMKDTLHTAEQNWQVWTIWYNDRLDGDVRDEERELAYVRIDKELWDQGPAIVNAEIIRRIDHSLQTQSTVNLQDSLTAKVKRRGEQHTPPRPRKKSKPTPLPDIPPALPAPIENVPSAVSFGWTSKGTVTVVLGELNWPAFPFKGGEQDHKHRLEACRSLATDTGRGATKQEMECSTRLCGNSRSICRLSAG